MTKEDHHDEDCAENCSGPCDADPSPDARTDGFSDLYHLVGAGIIGIAVFPSGDD